MALYSLENETLTLTLSEQGGSILELAALTPNGRIPLLRPSHIAEDTTAIQSSCFPLVPFGNRVENNWFEFEGKTHTLTPNIDWDPHYLHGDGWLNRWHGKPISPECVQLRYEHTEGTYHYQAEQTFTLAQQTLTIALRVTNIGPTALPFGLGWHPYLPLQENTVLQAKASALYLEEAGWMAGERSALTPDLDFNTPKPLPHHWVNQGFDGWDGSMKAYYPTHKLLVTMQTQPTCPAYFIFVSDPKFDPDYTYQFFCFEPMSHLPNGHKRPEGGHLQRLAKGESMQLSLSIAYEVGKTID